MVTIAPVSSKGQITLPAPLRRKYGIGNGKTKVIIGEERGKISLEPIKGDITDLYGILKDEVKGPVDIDKIIKEAKRRMAAKIAKEGLE